MDTLKAMFADWDDQALSAILATNNGSVEASVDTILSCSSCAEWHRQQTIQAPPPAQPPATMPHTSVPNTQTVGVAGSGTAQPAQMIMVTAPANSSPNSLLSINYQGQQLLVRVPPGVPPGGQFVISATGGSSPGAPVDGLPIQQAPISMQQPAATNQAPPSYQESSAPAAPPKRGRNVTLPSDFLRVPGSSRSSEEMTDEQLAALLQNELFLQELSTHPEFEQLRQNQLTAYNQHQNRATEPSGPSTAGSQQRAAPAASASSPTPDRRGSDTSTGVSSMASAMKNRLKAFARGFNNRRRGYDELGDLNNDEAVLPWNDPNSETVTFNTTSNVLRPQDSNDSSGDEDGFTNAVMINQGIEMQAQPDSNSPIRTDTMNI